MTEREKAKQRLGEWWQRITAEALFGKGYNPYMDPKLAHLDPDLRPGMAAVRNMADEMGKR